MFSELIEELVDVLEGRSKAQQDAGQQAAAKGLPLIHKGKMGTQKLAAWTGLRKANPQLSFKPGEEGRKRHELLLKKGATVDARIDARRRLKGLSGPSPYGKGVRALGNLRRDTEKYANIPPKGQSPEHARLNAAGDYARMRRDQNAAEAWVASKSRRRR